MIVLLLMRLEMNNGNILKVLMNNSKLIKNKTLILFKEK